jgi:hypothetical protein
MKLAKYLIPICAVVSHDDQCRDQLPHCPDLIATCNNEQAGLSESGKRVSTVHIPVHLIINFKSASHFVRFVKSPAGIVMLQATNIQLLRHYRLR